MSETPDVLLVDDDGTFTSEAERHLNAIGVATRVMMGAAAARIFLEAQGVPVVVISIKLLKQAISTDGVPFALMMEHRHPNSAILITTCTDEIKDDSPDLRSPGVFKKPINLGELAEVILRRLSEQLASRR